MKLCDLRIPSYTTNVPIVARSLRDDKPGVFIQNFKPQYLNLAPFAFQHKMH